MGGREPTQSADHDCLDQVFAALGHRQRRRVLAKLHERSPRDLGEVLDEDATAVSDGAAVDMHHRHLPKLDDLGFVEWDGDVEGTVRRGPKFDELARVIDLMESHGSDLPGDWP